MAVKFVEGAVDALRDYFVANMGAKVTALNTEFGDSLLTNPADWLISETNLESIQNWPTGYVLAKTSPLQPAAFASDGTGYFDGTHNIDIGVMDRAGVAGLEDLQRGVYRYMRVVVELILEAEPSDLDGFNVSGALTPLYSQTATRGSFMFSGGIVSVVLAKREVKTT